MNIWDILIIAVVALIVGLAVRSIVLKKGGTCSCGCADCPSRSCCTENKK